MPRRFWRTNDARWVRQLLPACQHDPSLARRQLAWLKEKVLADRKRPSTLPLTRLEAIQMDRYINDRVVHHKPLQYILGTQPFCNLDVITQPPVLIPRWETEEWTDRLINLIRPQATANSGTPLRILDVCTGTGCIALAHAAEVPHLDIVGIDISQTAISLAQRNQRKHSLQSPVYFMVKNVFDKDMSTLGKFDMIVSNPPYIASSEYDQLDADVKDWEDSRALVAEENGTVIHRRIAELGGQLLRKRFANPGFPQIVMEMGGTHQVPALTAILEQNGFTDIRVWKDLAGKDRVILASFL